ncbi:MAG: hypothetical protein WCP85_28385 [Mariniphaga sp.]
MKQPNRQRSNVRERGKVPSDGGTTLLKVCGAVHDFGYCFILTSPPTLKTLTGLQRYQVFGFSSCEFCAFLRVLGSKNDNIMFVFRVLPNILINPKITSYVPNRVNRWKNNTNC